MSDATGMSQNDVSKEIERRLLHRYAIGDSKTAWMNRTILLLARRSMNDAELSALRAANAEVRQWKPIETAPKDGTLVLVIWGTRPDIGICEYSKSAALERPDMGGWLRNGAWLDNVTHWMPLQKLPSPR